MELIPLVLSVISILLSVIVAWLTLFRRGSLGMTKPMLIGFLYEGEQPKIFFRTMLYATGKRGHIIEALYLKVHRGQSTRTFNFWMYGEKEDLKIGSGLRVGDDGVSFNHHFLPPKDAPEFAFLKGEYDIEACAKILNRSTPITLSTVKISLSNELAKTLSDHTMGVLFTWRPDQNQYLAEASEPRPAAGYSRSVSGAGRGRIPWA